MPNPFHILVAEDLAVDAESMERATRASITAFNPDSRKKTERL